MGEDGQTETLLSAQAPTMVGLAWARPLPPTALPLPTGEALNPHVRETNMCRTVYRGAQSNRGSNSLQCFRYQGWGHMARECVTPTAPLNWEGGTKGMWSKPPPTTNSKF